MRKNLFYGIVAALSVITGSLLPLSAAQGPAQEVRQKQVVIIADFGKAGPSPALLKVLQKYPQLRLTIPWPARLKVADDAKALVAAHRIEQALVLNDEPVFPLIDSTRILEPLVVDFSWPGDIADVIIRNQLELRQAAPQSGRGLYLRSGIFTLTLIPSMKKAGLQWITCDDPSGRRNGAFIRDNFLLLIPQKRKFAAGRDWMDAISASSAPITVFSFTGADQLTPDLLNQLGAMTGQNTGLHFVTPDQLYTGLKHLVPSGGDLELAPDLSSWTRAPIVWFQLDSARTAIEDYKNSGQAQLRLLGRLHDEIYRLYNYELIGRLQKQPKPDPEDEKAFQAGLGTIYRLLNHPAVTESDFAQAASTDAVVPSQVFAVENTPASLVVTNSLSSRSTPLIEKFSVALTPNSVVFSVGVASETPKTPVIVDVYMDLNNQEGAGLTRLLPGIEGFMDVANGWEFALRIEKGQATLYRSGRFEPTVVNRFAANKNFEVEIPRTVLRGNPLNWGYQAVLSSAAKGKAAAYVIDDFLSQEDKARQKALSEFPVQLGAIRAGSSR